MPVTFPYRSGEWIVQCDRCGRNRYRSDCTHDGQHPELLVCRDTCCDEKNPQTTLEVKPEINRVTEARPEGDATFGTGADATEYPKSF